MSASYTSNAISFAGFFGTRTATVDNGGHIILNGSDVGSTASIKAGDTVAIKGTAAALPEVTINYTLKVSSLERVWPLTTRNKTPPVLVITPSSQSGMYVDGSVAGTPTIGSTVTFTIKNTAEADAGAVSINFTGSTPSNFAVQSNGCAAGVAGYSGSCTVTIYPTAMSTAALAATMTASASGASSGTSTLTGDALFPITLSAGTMISLQTLPEMSGGFATTRWSANRPKRFVIEAGTTIGSTDPATPALQAGTGFGNTIYVTNNGNIQGAGGVAGPAGAGGTGNGGNGGGGGQGGTAFLASSSAVNLTNSASGKIWGGGGGGSGGGAGGGGSTSSSGTVVEGPVYSPGSPYSYMSVYAGSWYWAYWEGTVLKGPSGWPMPFSDGTWTYYADYLGADYGTSQAYAIRRERTVINTVTYSGGSGGLGGRGQGYDGANASGSAGSPGGTTAGNGGAGGNGGTWGSAGTVGANGTDGNAGVHGNAGALGAAGYAVKGTLTFSNSGQILGTVGP